MDEHEEFCKSAAESERVALSNLVAIVKERDTLKLQNDELKKLIVQALPFLRSRHEWKPTAPHADMIRVLEIAVTENQKEESPGVFCLDHMKVMTSGTCPKCGQQ